ncbi:MAG: CDP-glycerol glycerophosphotransferase family protein [Lachnospirales bacterium]
MNKKLIKAINLFCFFIYNRITSVFIKIDENQFVFLSEAQKQLDGNLKCVYDALDNKYSKKVYIKGDRRKVNSLKETISIWKALTNSKYIVLDDFYGLTSALRVRRGQEVVQLWHGAGAYKKFGYSRVESIDKIWKLHSGYKKYTKAIVSSENVRECYSQAFGIDISKVHATGVPRTDNLLNKSLIYRKRKLFYERYPQFLGKKLVLFAPTYRGDKVEEADYNFEYANLNHLQEELGDEYLILTRWHRAIRNNIDLGKVVAHNCDKIYDMSEYKDINEVLIAVDLLVTDYSSIIFDYYLLNKPIVFFALDRKEYEGRRGLYFDFKEYVYGEVACNRKELPSKILEAKVIDEKRKDFGEKFMANCKGNSTENVINLILKG